MYVIGCVLFLSAAGGYLQITGCLAIPALRTAKSYTGALVCSRVDLVRMKERSVLNSRRLDMLAKPDKQEFQ